jgi:anti-anti-sigma regulatory factor
MANRSLSVPTLLVASTCGELTRDVRQALADGEQGLSLDFSNNAYTDDAGRLALISLGRTARAAGGPLVLRNPPQMLTNALSLAGLSAVFQVEKDAA